MLKIIGGELNRLSSANRSWLLDGFPRTKPQALSLFKIAPVQVVISLDVPFDVIIDRVKGQLRFKMCLCTTVIFFVGEQVDGYTNRVDESITLILMHPKYQAVMT